jgi:hypothetical protein
MIHVHTLVIRFRDGRRKHRMWVNGMRMEAVESLLFLTLDGRHYRYRDVAGVHVL